MVFEAVLNEVDMVRSVELTLLSRPICHSVRLGTFKFFSYFMLGINSCGTKFFSSKMENRFSSRKNVLYEKLQS